MLGTITKPTTLGIISMNLLVSKQKLQSNRLHAFAPSTLHFECVNVSLCCIPGLNEVDYSHYPGQAFQLQWLRSYLEAYKEHKGQCSDVTDREVEILFVQVNRFALVSICNSSCRLE